MFIKSLNELKNVKSIAICGIMAALALILNYVASISIGQYLRIGFSFLPNMMVDFLFGPTVGGLFGAALDVIKWFLKPTGPYFPGFTLSAALGAVIYGMFFYKKKVSLPRCIIAHTIVKAFVNCGLNTLWLNLLYGQAIAVILPTRILSNAINLPVDVALTYFAMKLLQKTVMPMLRADRREVA
jgi:riboflavin transporter